MIFLRNITFLTHPNLVQTSVFVGVLAAAQIFTAACSGAGARTTAQISLPSPANSSQHSDQNPSLLASYTVKRGDSTLLLARGYLSQSSLMTVAELDAAIRDANGLKKGVALKPGLMLTIPTLEKQPIVESPRPSAKDADVRAVYLTGTMAGSVQGMNIIRRWHELGGNAVVFDIKDSDGSVSVPFNHPLAPKHRPSISNLPKFVRFLHSQNMHAIARIALFRDENIAQKHSQLAVRSRSNPNVPWQENGKLVWTDPSNPEVQAYNIALAKFVAQSGADEIQFDYVRFPAEGNQKDARFVFEGTGPSIAKNTSVTPAKSASTSGDNKTGEPSGTSAAPEKTAGTNPAVGMQRKDVIAKFLDLAYSELHPMGVLVSVDVFGVMAWQRTVDLSHTGQDIVQMAKHCDVLSPMIYPSHFFGMDGYTLPGDAPEHFIATSMARFQKITADSGVTIRPWLQAFGWKTKTYSPDYIRTQVLTSKQQGGIGFLLWNARNDYSKPFAAMPTMMAATDRYFGKRPPVPVATPAANGVIGPIAGSKPEPQDAQPTARAEAPSQPEQKSAPATAPQKINPGPIK